MTLYFLKLGGSLITDKARAQTAHPAVLARLADEIAQARADRPDLRLLIGHGSGSFGHVEAKKHGTRGGVTTPDQWRGFAEVSAVAARLNRIVTDTLLAGGVPVISFQPSASAWCRDGAIEELSLTPIATALELDLVPLVYGDVAFDSARGGTIVSTEDIFRHLARQLRPTRILLAAIEDGVYADWPGGRTVIPEINPGNAAEYFPAIRDSGAPDVTGGMATKVGEMLALVSEVPGLEVLIFSGVANGHVFNALTDEEQPFGTRIANR